MSGKTKLALVAALAMAAAMFLGWQSGETVVSPAAAPTEMRWALPVMTGEDAEKDMSFLTERHPWDPAGGKPAGAQAGADQVEKTTWRLAGIVERSDGLLALIAIGPPGAVDLKYCAVGDKLPDGSRLVEITPETATSEGPDAGSAKRTLRLFRGAQTEASPEPKPPTTAGPSPVPLNGQPLIGNPRSVPPAFRRLSQ